MILKGLPIFIVSNIFAYGYQCEYVSGKRQKLMLKYSNKNAIDTSIQLYKDSDNRQTKAILIMWILILDRCSLSLLDFRHNVCVIGLHPDTA